MNKKTYKRRPGEFEIRILPDGKVVMLAPDETMMEIARVVDPLNTALPSNPNQKNRRREQNHAES